jgi:hypothetical protein
MSERWTTGMTETYVEPTEPAPDGSNGVFGLGLFAISLLLFAGTFGVALVYLALD